MHPTSTGIRVAAAAATVLLLLTGAACSQPQSSPGPAGTAPASAPMPTAASSTPAGSSTPTPSAAAPSTPGPAASAPSTPPGSALPPPATTAVPAPTPGSTAETVQAKPEVTKKAVELDKPSADGSGVVVRIAGLRAITAKAQLPGEVAGPAVALTVEVENESQRPVDLGAVVVTVLDSEEAPGIEMSAKPADPLSGKLRPGKSTTGVYVFTVDRGRRNPISVNVTLAGAAPVLVFKGDAR